MDKITISQIRNLKKDARKLNKRLIKIRGNNLISVSKHNECNRIMDVLEDLLDNL